MHLVNLHQESNWTPRDGWVKSLYLPLHIIMGWLVTTLAAVSITYRACATRTRVSGSEGGKGDIFAE